MFRHLITLLAACFALSAFAAVEVNQATQAELETVKGIGPGLSAKITEARKSGQFKDWSDMVERVGGIGPGNAARFSQAGLTVSGAAFEGSAATAKPAKAAKSAKSTQSEGAAEKSRSPRKTKAAESSAS